MGRLVVLHGMSNARAWRTSEWGRLVGRLALLVFLNCLFSGILQKQGLIDHVLESGEVMGKQLDSQPYCDSLQELPDLFLVGVHFLGSILSQFVEAA